MSRHRAETRPRWGRIGLLGASALVTVVAVLAGFGLVGGSSDATTVALDRAGTASTAHKAVPSATPRASARPEAGSPAHPAASSAAGSATGSASGSASASPSAAASSASSSTSASDAAPPANSGSGRRAVFSQAEQRVWIIGSDGHVERTYPVSGSSEDNLRPGTYHVYGKSRWAIGIDDSGTMQYFVRFAHGTDNGASIGFHSIPTKDGKPLQTVAQLGERLSHGCIRQQTADAIAMWDFASVGTEVVVVA